MSLNYVEPASEVCDRIDAQVAQRRREGCLCPLGNDSSGPHATIDLRCPLHGEGKVESNVPLATINWRWLEAALYGSGFWVRIFGRGVWFNTYAGLPVLFSEREGYTRVNRIGSWARWSWLRKITTPGGEGMAIVERSLKSLVPRAEGFCPECGNDGDLHDCLGRLSLKPVPELCSACGHPSTRIELSRSLR